MSNELTIAEPPDTNISLTDLATQLAKRESAIDQHASWAVDNAVQTIALLFEQGDDLLLAKSQLKHGLFLPWVEQNFPKSYDTANDYMKFAAAVPKLERAPFLKDPKSIRKSFELAGIIPPIPTKAIANGEDVVIPPWLQKLTWLAEWYGKNPPAIDEMETVARLELKSKLNPIVEIYEKL